MRLVFILTLFIVIFKNVNAQNQSQTKLISELGEKELCAYSILKKIIVDQTKDKGNIDFFSKIDIHYQKESFRLSTNIQIRPKTIRGIPNDSIIRYAVSFRNLTRSNHQLPMDSISLSQSISYTPNYKISSKARCLDYEWIIYNPTNDYVKGHVVNVDFFIVNEKDFDKVKYVDKEYAIVGKNNKYGIIDRNNKIILPIEYDKLIKNQFGLLVKKNGDYYYFNPLTKKRLSNVYSHVYHYIYFFDQRLSYAKRNGKYTLLNSRFQEISPLSYDGFMRAGSHLIGKKDGKWVVINSVSGKEQTMPYNSIRLINRTTNHLKVQESNKYGIIGNNGEKVVEPIYQDIITSINNLENQHILYGLKKDNRIALFNYSSKRILTDFEYDDMFSLFNLIGVKLKDKYGAIDSNGNILIPIKYDKIEIGSNSNSKKGYNIRALLKNQLTLFDSNGKMQ